MNLHPALAKQPPNSAKHGANYPLPKAVEGQIRKGSMSTSTQNELFEIRFWGTRGTLPTPGPQFARAGGNTNCTEITCGSHTIVIDAGTGIRELGSKLISSCENQHIHLLLTHAHYDHVEAYPSLPRFSHMATSLMFTVGRWTEAQAPRRPSRTSCVGPIFRYPLMSSLQT